MAIPKIFISSTCYDLKYIRDNLRYFIRTLGYEPILSEDGAVFFNPQQHTHDACLTEIPNTQLFILIIGGRRGGQYHKSDSSITNMEYKEAARLRIPIFTLVESSVYNEHHVYTENIRNADVDLRKFKFPAVDSLKIFEFIDEVRSNSVNNALVPFRDFSDMESYLRQQWAGMMFYFLQHRNEERRVTDTLKTLENMNARIEVISKRILESVGTADAKVDVALYDELIGSESVRDLAYWGKRATPSHILMFETLKDCATAMGVNVSVEDDQKTNMIGGSGIISALKMRFDSEEYLRLRQELMNILQRHGMTAATYLASRPVSSAVAKK